MSVEDHFLDQVTVLRSEVVDDPYGVKKPAWSPQVIVPGRLVQKDRRVWDSDSRQSLVVSDFLLLLPEGTDVTDRDQVEVDGVAYKVESLLTRRSMSEHHLSLRVSLAG